MNSVLKKLNWDFRIKKILGLKKATRIRVIISYTLFLNCHSNKVKHSGKVWGKVLFLVSGKKKLRKQERKHIKQKTPLENVGPNLKSCIAMTDLEC